MHIFLLKFMRMFMIFTCKMAKWDKVINNANSTVSVQETRTKEMERKETLNTGNLKF